MDNCFVRSTLMLRYGMANEESFQSLSEETTNVLSATGVDNPRTVKSRGWREAEVEPYRATGRRLYDIVKISLSPLRFIQCLVFPSFLHLSSSSSNISSRVRAAEHLFTVDRSRASF